LGTFHGFQACRVLGYIKLVIYSFKSLFQYTISENTSLYTDNTHIYIHYKYKDISTNQLPSL